MSSFQQKLALKGSETSIEHFASVLKEVKDRGGWNTASALVSSSQTKKEYGPHLQLNIVLGWVTTRVLGKLGPEANLALEIFFCSELGPGRAQRHCQIDKYPTIVGRIQYQNIYQGCQRPKN